MSEAFALTIVCTFWYYTNMASKLAKIQNLIYEIRGQKVMFDRDLSKLYDVELKVMNQAVKRNIERFPPRFYVPINGRRMEKSKVTNCDL